MSGWADTPPTGAGWYWYLNGPDDDLPECVRVGWCQRGSVLMLHRGGETCPLAENDEKDALWCGPIPPPDLPTRTS